MRVKLPATMKAKRRNEMVIGYDRPEAPDLKDKTSYESLKLYTDPTHTNSAAFTINVPYFKTGTPEEYLLFRKALKKVIIGQNLTSGPAKFATTRCLLQGDTRQCQACVYCVAKG